MREGFVSFYCVPGYLCVRTCGIDSRSPLPRAFGASIQADVASSDSVRKGTTFDKESKTDRVVMWVQEVPTQRGLERLLEEPTSLFVQLVTELS